METDYYNLSGGINLALTKTELGIDTKDLPKLIDKLEKDMHKAAKVLDFERAAEIRDQLKKLREMVKTKK